ncbi:ABC-type multidrug transport system, ATPase component [Saccharicrinis carchari]|uniref:ABC-type multidrug transport system, ATPase component n=1 Tax=Saccharicrinis carchari TaxID=1168039 RepID=A0A521AS63_SACCC|nr:ATP-binding cassette domain-containing protein [Saccharicrinis carchari]SMO37625.1 ABC-type multidrug transport system, ATPase component [Saccharicrinis carchari]
MELYFKHDTLKIIAELFGLFRDNKVVSECAECSHLDQYMSVRFSQRVRMQMLDYYNDFVLQLKHNQSEDYYHNQLLKCLEHLYGELSKNQKMELYVALLIYVVDTQVITGDSKNSYRATQQLKLVSKVFELDEGETASVANFVRNNLSFEVNSKRLIVVGNFSRVSLRSFRMFHKTDLKGKLMAHYVPSMSSFLIKYTGNGQLQLNKQVIFPQRTYPFSPGGLIEAEDMCPLYFSDLQDAYDKEKKSGLELVARSIEKTFSGTNLGVKELSFKVKSGQLMAVMGGSGTGKTTLFNILSGVALPDKGKVYLNGYDLHHNLAQLKKHLGYVPQEDLLIEELTVAQNLAYSARLCRNDLSSKELECLIIDTLNNFELNGISGLKVGSPLDKVISGGQRKRLNIALELIRRPDVLFVDEPTSGLSSSDALLVVKLLKKIANMGNIVIVNIHQPTSDLFVLFDRLLILDEKGYAAYYGNPFSAASYFKKQLNLVDSINDDSLKYGQCNPEQVINLLQYRKLSKNGELTGQREFESTHWHKLFIENAVEEEITKNTNLGKPLTSIPTKLKQFWIYLKRNIDTRKTDLEYLALIFLGAPILAFMMAFFLKSTDLFTQEYRFIDNVNLPAYLFISVVVALFLGLILSSGEIYRDLKVIKRESFLNLSAFSYLNSKVVYVAVVNAVQILLFVWVGNSILEIKGLFFRYFIILWLTAMASSLMGLYISARFKTILSIYITIPFLLIPQILLAGAILDFDKMHHSLASDRYVPIYANLALSRWAYEALMVLQFTENKYDEGLNDLLIEQSKLSYHANFFVPKMETLLVELNKSSAQKTETEILGLLKQLKVQFPQLAKQTDKLHVVPIHRQELQQFLMLLKKWLRSNLNKLHQKVEQQRLEKGYRYPKTDYFNQKLSDFMLKTNDFNKYVYRNGQMLRKFQPGYHVTGNKWGRSHYYAPYKTIAQVKVKTWMYNMYVLIAFCIFIYLLIYLHLVRNKF